MYCVMCNYNYVWYFLNVIWFLLLCAYLVADLSEVDVNTFLGPFLEVIRSEDTTGPVTGVALSSVNKFLSYGLVGMFTAFYYSASSIVFWLGLKDLQISDLG